jgi:DNA-binding NarL/FixJ family response regulator
MTSEAFHHSPSEPVSIDEALTSVARERFQSREGSSPAPVALPSAQTTIVIIEPRALIRDCLLQSLQLLTKGDNVVAYGTIEEWRKATGQPAPATIILLCPAGRKAGEKCVDIGRLPDDIPVVLLSDLEEAEQIFQALDSGAKGYIPTSIPLHVAVEALHLVKAGGVFVPASSLISSRRSIEEHAHAAKNQGYGMFTARQAAVVNALRQGKANKRIAYELNMQESTVKVHIRNIMRKLKAKNRTEVAVLTQDLFPRSGRD